MTYSSPPKRKGVQIKTYVVMITNNLAGEGEPPMTILAVKLTRAAADKVANSIAGAFVDRHIATK